MARPSMLYKLLLVAGLCLALGIDAAPRPLFRPPPLRRPPPIRKPPPRQISPTPSPAANNVEVVITVSGQVSISTGHAAGTKDAESEDSAWTLVTQQEEIYRLVDKANSTDDASSINTRMEITSQEEDIITGDEVDAPLTLTVPEALADKLGLTRAEDNGPADVETEDTAADSSSSGSRRRQLTEHEHNARRMILDFHGTRRTLAEFTTLQSLLGQLGGEATRVLNQVPKAKTGKSKANGGAKDLMIDKGKPQNVTSLAFFFSSSSCGIVPKLTGDNVRARWFDSGDSAAVTATLQRYHKVCSYDKLQFRTENNLIFGPIDIPCVGTQPTKGAYDLKKGNANKVNLDGELYGLWDLAKAHLREKYPDVFYKLSTYRRKIMLWPFNNQAQILKNGNLEIATFAGLANMGCPGNNDCLTWMNQDMSSTSTDLTTLFQELGHNIGLAHSTRTVCDAAGCVKDEYGDSTDPMGGAGPVNGDKTFICLSAPQAYKAGWANPVADLTIATDLSDGGFTDFTVPSMHASDTNYLRLIVDQTGINALDRFKPQRAIYVSYRVAQAAGGYDSGLHKDLNGRVWVHEYNETANLLSANLRTPPVVLAMLDLPVLDAKTKKVGPPVVPGWGPLPASFSSPKAAGALGGLRVVLKSKTADSATIGLCRYEVTKEEGEELCTNGRDDDCDGLSDAEDPDCGGEAPEASSPPPPLLVLRKSPPPSPPPPPPPPPPRPPPPPKKLISPPPANVANQKSPKPARAPPSPKPKRGL